MASGTPPAANEPAPTEQPSGLEPWIVETLCQPLLERLPRAVAPNAISLASHALWWAVAALALVSPALSPWGRTLALVGAGLGTLGATITDCLDGMQARRTGRCSRLGEMLDHWLDAVHVPLLTLALVSALELEPWAVASVHIIGSMVFNAQLVLHQHSGKFVNAETSGTEATFGASIGFVLLAALLLVVDRSSRGVGITFHVAAGVSILLQAKLNLFYYRRLGRAVVRHLPFVLTCGAFAALYLVGAIGQLAFLFTIVFVSFRISGTFVLYKILGRPFAGVDLGLGLAVATIAASHWLWPHPGLGGAFGGLTIPNLLAWLSCGYMLIRNLWDFAQHYSALRPGRTAASPGAR